MLPTTTTTTTTTKENYAFTIEAYIAGPYRLNVAVPPSATVADLRAEIETAFARQYRMPTFSVLALRDPNHNDMPLHAKATLLLRNGDRVYVMVHKDSYVFSQTTDMADSPTKKQKRTLFEKEAGTPNLANAFRTWCSIRDQMLKYDEEKSGDQMSGLGSPVARASSRASNSRNRVVDSPKSTVSASGSLVSEDDTGPNLLGRPYLEDAAAESRDSLTSSSSKSPFARGRLRVSTSMCSVASEASEADTIVSRIRSVLTFQSPKRKRDGEFVYPSMQVQPHQLTEGGATASGGLKLAETLALLDALPARCKEKLPKLGRALVSELSEMQASITARPQASDSGVASPSSEVRHELEGMSLEPPGAGPQWQSAPSSAPVNKELWMKHIKQQVTALQAQLLRANATPRQQPKHKKKKSQQQQQRPQGAVATNAGSRARAGDGDSPTSETVAASAALLAMCGAAV